jgi:mono/diheme cytochrome c family protein
MISARMSRPAKVLVLAAVVTIAAVVTACGTESIGVQKSNPLHEGAVLFSQRCAGCHTFSYAATHGSAANVRSAQANNGPNFDIRCERPVARVLYAIENGGFSGAYMPQNVVVGQDAIKVAEFVATYSGRHAPTVPGVQTCSEMQVSTIPAFTPVATTTPASSTTTATTGSSGAAKPAKHKHAKKKPGHP